MAIEEGVVVGVGVLTTADLVAVGISHQFKAEETLPLRADVATSHPVRVESLTLHLREDVAISYLVRVEETLHLRAGVGNSHLVRVEEVTLRTHVVAGITLHLKVVASITISEVAGSRIPAPQMYREQI